jgi:crossover junction endodeoxyribonuclease RuvC
LAAAEAKIPSHEYSPAEVKKRVTDYGASSKEQVQEMVKLQLGLAKAPEYTDAADALAVAICHLRRTHLDELLAKSEEKS